MVLLVIYQCYKATFIDSQCAISVILRCVHGGNSLAEFCSAILSCSVLTFRVSCGLHSVNVSSGSEGRKTSLVLAVELLFGEDFRCKQF